MNRRITYWQGKYGDFLHPFVLRNQLVPNSSSILINNQGNQRHPFLMNRYTYRPKLHLKLSDTHVPDQSPHLPASPIHTTPHIVQKPSSPFLPACQNYIVPHILHLQYHTDHPNPIHPYHTNHYHSKPSCHQLSHADNHYRLSMLVYTIQLSIVPHW